MPWSTTAQIVFLFTGVFSTVVSQFLFYSGAAEKSTLMPVLAACLGNSFAVFLPASRTGSKDSADVAPSLPGLRIFLIGLLEITGNILGLLGIIFAGSGTYQVVYSSVVLFIALFSRIWLGRTLSTSQMLALVSIVLGLSLSALRLSPGVASTPSAASSTQLLGTVFTLLCAIVFGLSYVVGESVLTKSGAHPFAVQSSVSSWALLFIAIYSIVHTIPRFDSLVIDSITVHKGVVNHILFAYVGLMISAFSHTLTYYFLLQRVGSLSTGVLQSLRAVSVFWISHFLYCDSHSDQCMNVWKTVSTALVVVGLLWYSWASPAKSKAKVTVSEGKTEENP